MAYLDTLPETNLSAVDIRDTIGCDSNRLAYYCVGDISGGYAFKVVEGGGSPSDGELIGTPCFNIYSPNAPGEWVRSGTSVYYRLKRNSYGDIVVGDNTFTSTSYCYDLGAFAGYIHASRAPCGSAIIKQTLNTQGNYDIYIAGFDPGDYDWASLVPTVDRGDLYYGLDWNYSSYNLSFTDDVMRQVDDYGAIFTQLENVSSISSTLNPGVSVTLGLYQYLATDNYRLLCTLPLESDDTGNSGDNFSNLMEVVTDTDSSYQSPTVTSIGFIGSDGSALYYPLTEVSITSIVSGDSITLSAYYGSSIDYGVKVTILGVTWSNDGTTYSSTDTISMRQSSNNSSYNYLYYISGTISGVTGLQGAIAVTLKINY